MGSFEFLLFCAVEATLFPLFEVSHLISRKLKNFGLNKIYFCLITPNRNWGRGLKLRSPVLVPSRFYSAYIKDLFFNSTEKLEKQNSQFDEP